MSIEQIFVVVLLTIFFEFFIYFLISILSRDKDCIKQRDRINKFLMGYNMKLIIFYLQEKNEYYNYYRAKIISIDPETGEEYLVYKTKYLIECSLVIKDIKNWIKNNRKYFKP